MDVQNTFTPAGMTMAFPKSSRFVVVGFGRVGRLCAELISASHDLRLAAVVRRPSSVAVPLPDPLGRIPVLTHIGQAQDVDGALICVPTSAALETVSHIVPHGIPTVDCLTLHGKELKAHQEAVHRAAVHHGTRAIIGAGWDPGVLSVFRSWFGLLTPGGVTETRHHTGISLRHTALARNVAGVRDALCAEVRGPDQRLQRYVYVQLEKTADPGKVTQAIRADPLFLEEETQVFVVESLAELEQEGRGIVIDRRGPPGRRAHHHFVLEARADETVLTAEAMLAAARALPRLERPGAYTLSDLPLAWLWGERAERAQYEWL